MNLMKTKLLLIVLGLALSVSAQLPSAQAQQSGGTIAVLYHWKARPGKLEEYNRYIREVAEPIDAEAGKQGAFVSVTTFVSSKADSPWTHLRVFVLKDKAQLDNLSNALDAATVKLEPDEAKRKKRGEYSATLRDLVSREVVDVLK
jgi:hypothetical protein